MIWLSVSFGMLLALGAGMDTIKPHILVVDDEEELSVVGKRRPVLLVSPSWSCLNRRQRPIVLDHYLVSLNHSNIRHSRAKVFAGNLANDGADGVGNDEFVGA